MAARVPAALRWLASMMKATIDGVRITLDLECPRVGRYITLQNAGGGGNTAPTLLQVSELQVFGEPEAVGVFTRHPLFSYSHDKPTRWIWSRPDAASNAPPRDVMTHLFRSYHSTMAVNATMKVIADDYASVSVNGVLTEPQRTWPFAAVVPLALQQGHNLIVLHCRNFGGAAMAAAAVFATDGNNNTVVLLRTDHTWGWIEGPIHQ
ncbi:hypothetical protein PLESTM_001500300 [Pleodorina starrii]|nr:hypothetical protein PLESTM_001500300 [Pleodorina starrii]